MITPMRNMIACAMAATLLTSCTLLPQRAAQRTFQLPEFTVSSAEHKESELTLRVTTPLAESPLDGTRLLVMPGSSEIKAFRGVRWSKPLPSLVQDQLVEGLRQSGMFKAVVSDTSSALTDLALTTELSAFYLDAQNDPATVVLQIDAQVIDQGSKQLVAARRFSASQASRQEPVEEVVKGFGGASQTVTKDILSWLSTVIAKTSGETDQARQP